MLSRALKFTKDIAANNRTKAFAANNIHRNFGLINPNIYQQVIRTGTFKNKITYHVFSDCVIAEKRALSEVQERLAAILNDDSGWMTEELSLNVSIRADTDVAFDSKLKSDNMINQFKYNSMGGTIELNLTRPTPFQNALAHEFRHLRQYIEFSVLMDAALSGKANIWTVLEIDALLAGWDGPFQRERFIELAEHYWSGRVPYCGSDKAAVLRILKLKTTAQMLTSSLNNVGITMGDLIEIVQQNMTNNS